MLTKDDLASIKKIIAPLDKKVDGTGKKVDRVEKAVYKMQKDLDELLVPLIGNISNFVPR